MLLRATLLHRRRIAFVDAFAFDHLDVNVNRWISEPVDFAAGPANLDPINLFRPAQTEYFPGIVRRKITAASCLQTTSLYASGLPGNHRPGSGRIAPGRDQLQTEPTVFVSTFIPQQQRSFAVV